MGFDYDIFKEFFSRRRASTAIGNSISVHVAGAVLDSILEPMAMVMNYASRFDTRLISMHKRDVEEIDDDVAYEIRTYGDIRNRLKDWA